MRKLKSDIYNVTLQSYLLNLYPDVFDALYNDDLFDRDTIIEFLKNNLNDNTLLLPIDLRIRSFTNRLLPQVNKPNIFFVSNKVFFEHIVYHLFVMDSDVHILPPGSHQVDCTIYELDDDVTYEPQRTNLRLDIAVVPDQFGNKPRSFILHTKAGPLHITHVTKVNTYEDKIHIKYSLIR